ncbi:uncharacterized protein [Branchiostoma lanceolatum]|uniref:uncharacterized protein n=1 Tax=Branchiostoma lanceolatum TaxID=7740 RepID=UPI0034522D52
MGVCEYQNFKPDHPGEGSCCGFMDSTDGYQWGFGGQAGPDTALHYVCQTGTDYVCSVTEAAAAGCPVTEFTCPCPVPGGCCIIDDWVCDDFDDCMDNSDEALCQIEGEGDWIDVRNYWVLEWIGTDPGSAVVDTFRHTIWNAGGQDQYFNNWYIIMDFQVPHTIQHVRIINYGDLIHDVEAFRLDASPSAEPYQWDTVYSNGDVGVSHSIPQVFSGFSGSGRYWRFTCTKTYEGWQPWVKDLKFHGYVFIAETTTSSVPTTTPTPAATTTMAAATTATTAALPMQTTSISRATSGTVDVTTERDNSTSPPLTSATQRMGEGGSAAANTGGASGGAVAGGVVGTLAVVGVGGAVAGYLLYKKKRTVVEPKA